jgi:hypothetical protein
MKRIDVHYAGHLYSVGGRDLEDVQREVQAAQKDGGWIVVNDGEGSRRDAHLWVTSGTPIALIPISGEE